MQRLSLNLSKWVQKQGANLINQTAKRGMTLHSRVDGRPTNRFTKLPGHDKFCHLTYIWVDGTGVQMRNKLQTVKTAPTSIEEIKQWSFDGSSTGQAVGADSDMLLKPVAMCPDPFFPGPSKLVLCEVYDKNEKAAATNNRQECLEVVKQCEEADPWFGMEQEYTMMGRDGRPLGFPPEGFPHPQGPYYCSVGAGRSTGRDVSEAHYIACLYSNLAVNGTNAEVLLGQWEYQVGPSPAMEVADHLWLSRYILHRVGEEYGVAITLDPKPVEGDWNGTGNHANFSTKAMREDGGRKHIDEAVEKLSKRHMEHIAAYDLTGGEDNKRRLTGLHETADLYTFSAAAGSRNVSVRIPRVVDLAGKGWLEDRRPSADCDPYLVVSRMLKTVCLNQ